jgi:Tol biopolymer transport system component
LLDTKTDHARQLASGEDPTWSPDGKWIAYRSADNQATLLELRSAHAKSLLAGHEIAPLPLRWSPDSQYLAYVERMPAKAVQWHLAVLRLEDGATTVVTPFNTIVGYVADWWWIVNYQSFCRACAPH